MNFHNCVSHTCPVCLGESTGDTTLYVNKTCGHIVGCNMCPKEPVLLNCPICRVPIKEGLAKMIMNYLRKYYNDDNVANKL